MSTELSQLQRKFSELEALRKIVMAINSQIDDLDKVVRLILTKACELLSADHGSLMLIHPESQQLRIVAAVGADWTPDKRGCMLQLGQGITGRVAVTGEPYLCNETSQDSHYYPLFPNVASEVAVPVISQGRILGVINIDSIRQGAFVTSDQDLLQRLADHAAIAIENTRQFTAAQASRDQWRQIFDALQDGILVCDEYLNVLKVNRTFLNMFSVSQEAAMGHSAEKVLSQLPLFQARDGIWKRLQKAGRITHRFREQTSGRTFQMLGTRAQVGDNPIYVITFRESMRPEANQTRTVRSQFDLG
jgi:PAS domain S-box-containing protein